MTAGHRVTLTYNLLLDGDTTRRSSDQATIAEVAGALATASCRVSPVGRRGRPARPRVQRAGARGVRLKGDDVRRVSLLRAAADAAGFESVLALTDVRETWDALVPDGAPHVWDDDDPDVDEAGAEHEDGESAICSTARRADLVGGRRRQRRRRHLL